jgi:hypothetical protein
VMFCDELLFTPTAVGAEFGLKATGVDAWRVDGCAEHEVGVCGTRLAEERGHEFTLEAI